MEVGAGLPAFNPAMLRALLSLVLLACFQAFSTAADRPPNVVFIIADDLGWGDLGCYGQQKIRTPNLDRMASEGLRLTRHYSGNAVCAPSRCVLMTGKHPGHAWIRNNKEMKPEGQEPVGKGELLLPEILKAAGYTTGGFGKWGLGGPGTEGEPLKRGFDRWYGYNCQAVAHSFYSSTLWDNDHQVVINEVPVPGHGKLEPGEDIHNPASYARFSGKTYSADLIAEASRHFIRDHKDQPFYCFVPTTVPHLALHVPADSLAEYQGQWEDPPYPGGRGYTPHFTPRAAYAAMITRMDREIGRLMALVKELCLDEHTIFVFTSDNGPLYDKLGGTDCEFFNSHGGLRGRKGSLYEGGFRVPGIVRWAGKIRPGVSDRITGFEDWLPTVLDLAGLKAKIPAGLDGISFATTLLGGTQPERDFLYREFPAYGGQQSLHMGPWKLVRQNLIQGKSKGKKAKAGPATLELFDLANDPHEEKDVAADHPDVVEKMRAIMKAQHKPSAIFPFPALDP